jgi:hypothetical protein
LYRGDELELIHVHNISQLIQADYTIGHRNADQMYEIGLVRGELTRNLTVLFPDMYDEIEKAFDEYIPKTEGISSPSSSARPTNQKGFSRLGPSPDLQRYPDGCGPG